MFKVAPDSKDLESLVSDLTELISSQRAQVAVLRPTPVPAGPEEAIPPAEQPKWDPEALAALRKPTALALTTATPIVYRVKDKVMAMWKKKFVPATIMNIMGSAANPKYYVRYEGYSEYATLEGHELKQTESRKRRADDISAGPSTPVSASVISAAAKINSTLADQVKKEPAKANDGPVRPKKMAKKLATTKKLDANKSNWQAFTAGKTGGKVAKKESMFRTGDGFNARGEQFDHSLS